MKTKTCPGCALNLPLDAFGWRDSAHTKLQSYCQSCMREVWKEWYGVPKNKKKHLKQLQQRRRRRIERN